ncbi:MAG TPA: hypothetical protein VF085_06760 [Solirubrobacterales bacterium]
MLAYVFWHRPGEGVDVATYEQAQRAFHTAIKLESACFRVERLPFAKDGGYEDWYLVEDWAALGELNARAVDSAREGTHDRAAALAAGGWGGLYESVRGPAKIPKGTEWLDKPRGEPAAEFVASLPHESVWRRQLVLGPAPEFCCAAPENAARISI